MGRIISTAFIHMDLNAPITRCLIGLPVGISVLKHLLNKPLNTGLVSLYIPSTMGTIAWIILQNKFCEIEMQMGSFSYLKLMTSSTIVSIAVQILWNFVYGSKTSINVPLVSSFTAMAFFFATIPPYKTKALSKRFYYGISFLLFLSSSHHWIILLQSFLLGCCFVRTMAHESLPLPSIIRHWVEPVVNQQPQQIDPGNNTSHGAGLGHFTRQTTAAPSEEDVEELTAMGFSRERVVAALMASNNNKLQAIEKLLGS